MPDQTDEELASLKRENPVLNLPKEQQNILAELAAARSEGHIDRRTLLQAGGVLGLGAALGGGGAAYAVGEANAAASTGDSDGDIGTPGNEVDLFADGIAVDILDNVERPSSLSELRTALSGGDVVAQLEPGDYTYSSSVTLESNTILVLRGCSFTQANGANSDLFVGTSESDVVVIGGEFDGNRSNNTAGRVFDLDRFSHTVIRDVTINDYAERGIYITDTTSPASPTVVDVIVENVTVDGAASAPGSLTSGHVAIAIEDGKDTVVRDCDITNPWADGIQIYGDNVRAEHNDVTGSPGTGIALAPGAGFNADGQVAVGNFVEDCSALGISIGIDPGTASTVSTGAVVAENTIRNSGGTTASIYLQQCTEATVADNYVPNGQNTGILISSNAPVTECHIRGNDVINASGASIYVQSTAHEVTGNRCEGGTEGIQLASSASDCRVANNACIDNDNSGVYCQGCSDNTIIGNVCVDNGSSNTRPYGILLRDATENTACGNRCYDSGPGVQDGGILEDGTGNNNSITGNVLTGNASTNLSTAGASTQTAGNVT